MSLGIYISVPFCRAKCSFCNFASGVFAGERMEGYVERLCAEMRETRGWVDGIGAEMPGTVDSIYFGGGTPSLLSPELVREVFAGLRSEFHICPDAEVTVECAPGQLSNETLAAFQREGANRLSFGVQSFVDTECAAVGRLHTGAECRAELRRVMEAGIKRVSVDLICGLPHQTDASWRYTIDKALASGVEHVSVYMLEVDEDSRLGREKLRGGGRYGTRALPEEDHVADWYAAGCEWLEAGGITQYEISNFARPGGESRHNRKYWERKPYLGFGMDAHSMLRAGRGGVRWANADSMTGYMDRLGEFERTVDRVGSREAFEESLFLGLRLVQGVDLLAWAQEFGDFVHDVEEALGEVRRAGLVMLKGHRLKLTAKGRMVSNEVFGRLLLTAL